MVDFDGMTRKFLMGEGKSLNIGSYLRALQDGLSKLRPNSQSQAIVVENLKSHLRSVKKEVTALQERNASLEEQLKVLEESKGE
tara:strand:+ start:2281 stop:2532 length:252 start_codon:yes stop_codon:yes gene_type:complete